MVAYLGILGLGHRFQIWGLINLTSEVIRRPRWPQNFTFEIENLKNGSLSNKVQIFKNSQKCLQISSEITKKSNSQFPSCLPQLYRVAQLRPSFCGVVIKILRIIPFVYSSTVLVRNISELCQQTIVSDVLDHPVLGPNLVFRAAMVWHSVNALKMQNQNL